MGDTLPTTPKPPKTPKCGAFGQILQTAVTIAITQLLSMTPLAPVAPILGNAAGQLFGMATGIQQGGFNWKSLGMTALTIALPNPGGFIGGALNNAAAQGIGVAIGLQDKFSWSGVAAAGVGAGIAGAASRGLASVGVTGFGNDVGSTMADTIAQAATRSAIKGNSFGDNLIASLPSALGNLAGRALAQGIGTAFDGKTGGGAGAASSIHEAGHVDPKAVRQTVGNGMAGDVVTIYSGKASADTLLAGGTVVTAAGRGFVGADEAAISQRDAEMALRYGEEERLLAAQDMAEAKMRIVAALADAKVRAIPQSAVSNSATSPAGKRQTPFSMTLDESGFGSFPLYGNRKIGDSGEIVANMMISSLRPGEALAITEIEFASGYSAYEIRDSNNRPLLVSGGVAYSEAMQLSAESVSLEEAQRRKQTIGVSGTLASAPEFGSFSHGYFTNVFKLQNPASGAINLGHSQWGEGSYLSGGFNIAIGNLGYYSSYMTAGTASVLSYGRDGDPYADGRDLADAPIFEFALGGATAMRRVLTKLPASLDRAAARHIAWSSDLGAINDTVAGLGQRALRSSGGNWVKSEALFDSYLSLADARLARTGGDFRVELQPAAIAGGERVPGFIWMHRGDASSPLIMARDGTPRLIPHRGSRRLDAGIIDLSMSPNQYGLRPVVSGYDITISATKSPAGPYYREYFGNIPIRDIRLSTGN